LRRGLVVFVITLFFVLSATESKVEKKAVVDKAEKAHSELRESVREENISKYRDQIAENAKKIKSIKSSFRQVKHLSFLSDKVVTGGTFLLKKENGTNLVKWEYTTPFFYQIVLDGRRVYMKDGDKVTRFDMSSNAVFEELNEIMIKSLDGTILSENEKFSFDVDVKGRELYIKMVPSRSTMKEYFKEIKMVIDKKDFTVTKLEMIENGGDSTEIFFTERRINIPVDNKEFQLK
jgi:outer membrane lipoprotein-sorting protein